MEAQLLEVAKLEDQEEDVNDDDDDYEVMSQDEAKARELPKSIFGKKTSENF